MELLAGVRGAVKSETGASERASGGSDISLKPEAERRSRSQPGEKKQKNVSGRGTGRCKGPGVGGHLAHVRVRRGLAGGRTSGVLGAETLELPLSEGNGMPRGVVPGPGDREGSS